MGKDPTLTHNKLEEEANFDAKILEIQQMRAAESAAKAQAITTRYQMQAAAEAAAPQEVDGAPVSEIGPGSTPNQQKMIAAYAKKLMGQSPEAKAAALDRFEQIDPEFAHALKDALIALEQGQAGAADGGAPGAAPAAPAPAAAKKPAIGGADMRPLPQQRPPRRQGGV